MMNCLHENTVKIYQLYNMQNSVHDDSETSVIYYICNIYTHISGKVGRQVISEMLYILKLRKLRYAIGI